MILIVVAHAHHAVTAIQPSGHQKVHEIRDVCAVPHPRDRTLDEGCVHEGDRGGVREDERHHRGHGVESGCGFFHAFDEPFPVTSSSPTRSS